MKSIEELPLFQPKDANESGEHLSFQQLSLFPQDSSKTQPKKAVQLQSSSTPKDIATEIMRLLQKQKLSVLNFYKLLEKLHFPLQHQLKHNHQSFQLEGKHREESYYILYIYITSLLLTHTQPPEQSVILLPSKHDINLLQQTLMKFFPAKVRIPMFTYRDFCFSFMLPKSQQQRLCTRWEQELLSKEVLNKSTHDFPKEEWENFVFLLSQQKLTDKQEKLSTQVKSFFQHYQEILSHEARFDLDDILQQSLYRFGNYSGEKQRILRRFRYISCFSDASMTSQEHQLVEHLFSSARHTTVFGKENTTLPSFRRQQSLLQNQAFEVTKAPSLHVFGSQQESFDFMAKELSGLLSKKGSQTCYWGETFACVVSQDFAKKTLKKHLRKVQIPYQTPYIASSEDWQVIRSILDFFRHPEGNLRYLEHLLKGNPSIKEGSVQQISSYILKQEISPRKMIGQFDKVPNILTEQRILLGYLAETLIQVSRHIKNYTPKGFLETFWKTLNESPFFQHISFQPSSKRKLKSFFHQLHSSETLPLSLSLEECYQYQKGKLQEKKVQVLSYWEPLPRNTKVLFWPVPGKFKSNDLFDDFANQIPLWIRRYCEEIERIYIYYTDESLAPPALLNYVKDFKQGNKQQLSFL